MPDAASSGSSSALGAGPNPSAPMTSIVVFALTSSAVAPPRRATSARASLRPSELSFPVKTTSCPASGKRLDGQARMRANGLSGCMAGETKPLQDEGEWRRSQDNDLLAGDIGGTKTLLGLFDAATARPRPVAVRSFGTLDYADLPTMIAEFLTHDDAAGARAHGADRDGVLRRRRTGDRRHRDDLTNVPWLVDARQVAAALGLRRVALLERSRGDGVRGAGAARVRSARAAGGRGAARRQHRR